MNDLPGVRKMYSNYLRNNKNGNQAMWSKDELLAGLHYYYELNGAFPKAHQIDSFEYLPSSRSIQRSYGGLVKLRSELLPEEIANFTRGAHRSASTKRTFEEGRSYEKLFYDYLLQHFVEIAVHEHKLIRPGNVNSDFFIYMDQHEGVVIDIFYADSIINWVNVVNIKLKRYVLIEPETYLVVVGNDAITQHMIDEKVKNRKSPLPSHVKLASEAYFQDVTISDLTKRSIYSASS